MLSTMKNLAKGKDICVLATAAGGAPHCSLMAYATDEDCSEIYMATLRNTQKVKNLLENPSVSLLIDTREEHKGLHRREAKAMTIAGTCELIEEEAKKRLVRSMLMERHPHLNEFLNHQDAVFLCVRIASFLLLNGLTDAYFEEI